MADIDQILAGGAGASSRADFSGIADIPKYYYEGQERRARADLRDAFKGGVPTLPDGSIDYATMQRTLYQKGGLEQGNALIGVEAGQQDRALYAGGGQAPMVGPTTSRNSVTPDPTKRADASQPQMAPQGQPRAPATVMTVLAAQGIPNDQLQGASESIARQLGVDPTAPLNMQDPQVRNVLAPAVAQLKRMGVGQVAQAGQPAAQPIPQQPQAAPQQNDPELRRLRFLAASPNKTVAEAARAELKIKLEGQQPTNDMKHAAAMGVPLREQLDRADENTTKRDILTKSTIPRLEKSAETATAARNDIDAIHNAKGELDRNGGVFSGTFAEKRLDLAKLANLLGVPNADKIANTETYRAAVGARVAAMVKAFGSGTAISDGDRKFAEKMAGGNLDLDEKSMRRILDIGERAGRLILQRHNTLVDKSVKSNEALGESREIYQVGEPKAYKKAEPLPALEAGKTKVNGLTYKGGDPKDKANWVR